jgi:hypothetical protein
MTEWLDLDVSGGADPAMDVKYCDLEGGETSGALDVANYPNRTIWVDGNPGASDAVTIKGSPVRKTGTTPVAGDYQTLSGLLLGQMQDITTERTDVIVQGCQTIQAERAGTSGTAVRIYAVLER